MRTPFRAVRTILADWIRPKGVPSALTGNQWSGTSMLDAFHRHRNPTPDELMGELKATAFTCASINAGVCANFSPRLYVATGPGEPEARAVTRALDRATDQRLRARSFLALAIAKAARLEEVVDHPLLTLLRQVNPVHNSFDLWELTTLYQEVHGSAYWLLDFDNLGVPRQIWILPSQNVAPKRDPGSPNLVDYYEYKSGATQARYPPARVIHFRYPDPRNPYTSGLSPLRACWEQAAMLSDYTAFKKARLENRALPDAIVSPDLVLGDDQRARLQADWNTKLRGGGAGQIIVAETGLKVQLLNQSLGDVAALAEMGQTKEDIANAFHVPIAFLTSQTNLANLQASERLHMDKAIAPRLTRRDQKLNEQLVPLFDPSGRLFLASEDPVPIDRDATTAQQGLYLKYGVVTINELRGERGLPPVEWGDKPWLPLVWAPTDLPERSEYAPAESKPNAPTPRGGTAERATPRRVPNSERKPAS